MESRILYVAVFVGSWIALRHLVSMVFGYNRQGSTKPGQRWCHFTSFLILCGGGVWSVLDKSIWPVGLGVTIEFLYRRAIIISGQKQRVRE